MRNARALRIVLDPGHGNLPGHSLPRDPGAVGNGTTESAANMAVALTLKQALIEAGHSVILTRTDEHRPDWYDRTAGMGQCDLYLSLHHDTANGRSMAYYAEGRDYPAGPVPSLSKLFAQALDAATPDPEFICLPDTACRHGRLYIRSALAPVAVLWEVDPVRIATREERMARGRQLLDALERARPSIPTWNAIPGAAA